MLRASIVRPLNNCESTLGNKVQQSEYLYKHRLEKHELVQSLMAYKEDNGRRFRVGNGWDPKAYTAQMLLRLGSRWSFTA